MRSLTDHAQIAIFLFRERVGTITWQELEKARKGSGEAQRHVRADIMDFSADQQKEFLERWFSSVLCRELPPASKTLHEWREEQKQKATENAATIIAFLEREENQSLRLLAAVPMLLQIMAILWKERHYLPKTRSELYHAAVNYILDYRDRQKEIVPLLGAEEARRVLSPVSLWMQEELEKDEADKALMQQEMQKHLKTLPQPPSVEKFCENLIDRAGLLVAYGDKEYRFRHKSFREYMAGLQLEKKKHSSLGHLDKLVRNFGKDWWEEPLRFYIAEVDADAFDSFMEKLFDAEVSGTFNQKQQDLLVTLIQEARQTTTEALQKKLLDPATTTNRQRYILQCLKAIGTTEALGAVRQFINYLGAREAGYAAILPVESYKKSLFALGEGIKGFSEHIKDEKSLATRFRSRWDDDLLFLVAYPEIYPIKFIEVILFLALTFKEIKDGDLLFKQFT